MTAVGSVHRGPGMMHRHPTRRTSTRVLTRPTAGASGPTIVPIAPRIRRCLVGTQPCAPERSRPRRGDPPSPEDGKANARREALSPFSFPSSSAKKVRRSLGASRPQAPRQSRPRKGDTPSPVDEKANGQVRSTTSFPHHPHRRRRFAAPWEPATLKLRESRPRKDKPSSAPQTRHLPQRGFIPKPGVAAHAATPGPPKNTHLPQRGFVRASRSAIHASPHAHPQRPAILPPVCFAHRHQKPAPPIPIKIQNHPHPIPKEYQNVAKSRARPDSSTPGRMDANSTHPKKKSRKAASLPHPGGMSERSRGSSEAIPPNPSITKFAS